MTASTLPVRKRRIPVAVYIQSPETIIRAHVAAISEAPVQWYRYYATVHHRSPFVSYKILADLVRDGWRLMEQRPPSDGA